QETRTILLASDYAGARPLYYHVNQDRVVWSSYLRPLVAVAGAGEIDEEFVAGFLNGQGVPQRTPYRGIFSVAPGQAVRFGNGGSRALPFWELPVHNQIRYADERLYDE